MLMNKRAGRMRYSMILQGWADTPITWDAAQLPGARNFIARCQKVISYYLPLQLPKHNRHMLAV